MTATQTSTQTSTSTGFAGRLRAALEQDHHSVPEHRRARDWHGTTQCSVANPRRTRGLVREDVTAVTADPSEDFATRLRRAVG